mmetsp:Transcript_29384/g.49788  ORF Transcript_29384/g.49788 Transcript_29384/m.49788 type:complete len:202 (-) Transcript_29384:8016-8621(-)
MLEPQRTFQKEQDLHVHWLDFDLHQPVSMAAILHAGGDERLPKAPRSAGSPRLRDRRRRLPRDAAERQGPVHRHLRRVRRREDRVHEASSPVPRRGGGQRKLQHRAEDPQGQPPPRGLREREDGAEQQLEPLREVRGDLLQCVRQDLRRLHHQLPAGEVARGLGGRGRAELPHLLSDVPRHGRGAEGGAAPHRREGLQIPQ